jgi:hypothetical protein
VLEKKKTLICFQHAKANEKVLSPFFQKILSDKRLEEAQTFLWGFKHKESVKFKKF